MATQQEQLLQLLQLNIIQQQMVVLQKMRRRRRKRRWNVRPLNQSRTTTGEFAMLVRPLRDVDREMHFSYFRMSADRFDDILRRIQPHIIHQSTHSAPVDDGILQFATRNSAMARRHSAPWHTTVNVCFEVFNKILKL